MKLIIKLIKTVVRIFAAIVLLLILIVAIGLTIQHFTTKKAYKYHISQIQAERIALCDSFAHGINLYKLSFETVPTGYKHGLFVGGIEPYLEGCADSLTNIIFMTTPQASGNVLIPLQIKGNKVEALTLQECTGNDTIDGNFYDNTKDLGAFLQKGRPHLENYAHSSRILHGGTLFIATPKHVGALHRIIIRFENGQLICQVRQGTPKTYFIKSIVTNTPERLPKVINLNSNNQEMSNEL
ncbi:hypothetical protein [Paraprevotella xylaniphila]|uniref:hypothetical protein n=1 Tax=Paraprevotella xylaniphila TaxID=454155 RepID=UPI0023F33ABF|nr:hypothetical protein [Paraprevotella xylaniphila]